MSRAQSLADLKAATAELACARRKLADEQFCVRHRMPNNLAAATMIEHSAFHRWMRASTAYQNFR